MSDSEEIVNMWEILPDKIDEWDPFRYNNLYKLGLSYAKAKLSPLTKFADIILIFLGTIPYVSYLILTKIWLVKIWTKVYYRIFKCNSK